MVSTRTATALVLLLQLACSPRDTTSPSETVSSPEAAPTEPAPTEPSPTEATPTETTSPTITSGKVLEVEWSYHEAGGERRLIVGNRLVLLELLKPGCYTTDQLHGCWPGPAEIADSLLRFHPDFSPLAKKP